LEFVQLRQAVRPHLWVEIALRRQAAVFLEVAHWRSVAGVCSAGHWNHRSSALQRRTKDVQKSGQVFCQMRSQLFRSNIAGYFEKLGYREMVNKSVMLRFG
jgi:hypothetical protein